MPPILSNLLTKKKLRNGYVLLDDLCFSYLDLCMELPNRKKIVDYLLIIPIAALHMGGYGCQLWIDLPMREDPPVPLPTLNVWHLLDQFQS